MKTSQVKSQKNSIKQGDVFQLGQHRLMCGDATKKEDMEKLLDGEFIDLILSDPPYGVAYVENKAFLEKPVDHKPIANDHLQSDEEYRAFTRDWLMPLKPFLKKKNAFYIFNSDKMLFALRDGIVDAKFKFTQLLIWVKTGAVIGRMDYLPQHELIAYGWFGRHEFKKNKDKSVLVYPKPKKSKLHSTMKPVGLLRRLVLNSTNIGSVIVDPFGGSGSTLIAAEQTKRRCLMMELSPEYCETIISRFERLTGQKAKKLTPSR